MQSVAFRGKLPHIVKCQRTDYRQSIDNYLPIVIDLFNVVVIIVCYVDSLSANFKDIYIINCIIRVSDSAIYIFPRSTYQRG